MTDLRDPEAPVARRQPPLYQALLWFMRLGILAMLSVTVAFLYTRYHQSPEQLELVRYVEIDLPSLDNVERPIVQNMQALLESRSTRPEDARSMLVDELMPQLIRLRKLADAPVRASQTKVVKALATEYRQTIDDFIDACRTAVRVIDDPRLEARDALAQVHTAFQHAAERSQTWRNHVAQASENLHLLKSK